MQNIENLRDAMFKQLERLADPSLTTEQLNREIKRAHAVSKVADTIINSGELELGYMQAMERIIPMTGLMPDQGATKGYSSDHGARIAAHMRAAWSGDNPEKVKALKQATSRDSNAELTG